MLSRIACITPYHKESPEILERCLASVRGQTRSCHHYLVADGHPQDWIDALGVRHLKLPAAHGDFGNAARGLGALHAISEGADAIMFLDADNYLDANHLEVCSKAVRQSRAVDYVVALRRLVTPDGDVLQLREEPTHVDTSCYLLLPGTFHLVSQWILQPKTLAPIGDRLFLAALRRQKLPYVIASETTVNYVTLFESHYTQAGLPAPAGAKPVPGDRRSIIDWWRSRGLAEKERVRRALALPEFDLAL